MKKLWNSILTILLILTSCSICFSQLVKQLFQEDLGRVVLEEVNLDGQMDDFFDTVELTASQEQKEQLENLKAEMKSNTKIQEIISVTGRYMIDDIVDVQAENQDINEVVEQMLYTYDDEFIKVLDGQVSKEEIHQTISLALQVLPIQTVYDTAVQSFQSSLPESYLKIMKLVRIFANPSTTYLAIAFSILLVLLLIMFNFRYLRWSFSIGIAGVCSAGILLFMGQIVPSIFERLMQNVHRSITKLSELDFHIMSVYGIVYLVIGVISFLLYFTFTKKRLQHKHQMQE